MSRDVGWKNRVLGWRDPTSLFGVILTSSTLKDHEHAVCGDTTAEIPAAWYCCLPIPWLQWPPLIAALSTCMVTMAKVRKVMALLWVFCIRNSLSHPQPYPPTHTHAHAPNHAYAHPPMQINIRIASWSVRLPWGYCEREPGFELASYQATVASMSFSYNAYLINKREFTMSWALSLINFRRVQCEPLLVNWQLSNQATSLLL